jgi:hypothetical protein
MKNKTILIGTARIEKAMDELREKNRMDENLGNQIKKRLDKANKLRRSSYNFTIVVWTILALCFIFLQNHFQIIHLEKFYSESPIEANILSIIFLAGFMAVFALLFGFSFLLMRLIFHFPQKRAIAKLGEAVRTQELLYTLFRENFGPNRPKRRIS